MDGESYAVLVAGPTEVRGLVERGQGRVQARDEGVGGVEAVEERLRTTGRFGEVRGGREPGHVHVTRRRMDREGIGAVGETSAQVGGLFERGQGRVQARDEGVGGAVECVLRTTGRAGEVRGGCLTGHVHITRSWMDREKGAER